MQQEVRAELAFERIDDLLVLAGAERRHAERLRLAAGEQRRAMRTRQHADLNRDLAYGLGVAAVDARLAVEDGAANDVLLETLEELAGERLLGFVGEERADLRLGGVELLRARLLLRHGISGREIGRHGSAQLLFDGSGIGGLFRHGPRLFRRGFRELDDRLQHRLEGFVAEHHRAEHDFFRQLLGFGFDHQHAFGGAGDDELELRIRQLIELRIDDVLAIDIADARAGDRAHERNARDGQRRRSTDERDDVGIVLEIVAQHGADDLRLVEEARGEERPDRAIDEARRQHLFLGRTAFALEEATWDLAGGEGLFLVVDREREEILPRFRLLIGDSGAEHRGLAVGRHHRAIGLPRDFAGLEDEASAAPHQLFSIYLEHDRVLSLLSLLSGERHKGAARTTFRGRRGAGAR